MDDMQEVDFDFFDTPRKPNSEEREQTDKHIISSTPPRAPEHDKLSTEETGQRPATRRGRSYSQSSSEYSTSESESVGSGDNLDRRSAHKTRNSKESRGSYERSSSDSPSRKETYGSRGKSDKDRYSSKPPSTKSVTKQEERPISSHQKSHERYDTESSSAYSNSDDSYSTEEGDNKKTRIDVKMPKTVEAWGSEKKDSRSSYDRYSRVSSGKVRNGDSRNRDRQRSKQNDYSSDSDSSVDRNMSRKINESHERNSRAKSAKTRNSSGNNRHERPATRKRLGSRSSSNHSNNSDITDVSPLASPEVTPRQSEKRQHGGQRQTYDHAYNDEVQYDTRRIPSETDIKLDSDKVDLSILMKCMADIDKEKQERIKANSRRVMFAPPAMKKESQQKQNYSFTLGRAKMIEQENQRLLKQIMAHIQPGAKKPADGNRPVKKRDPEPAIHLVTPSAVNRQREQRKIEMENMKMLNRLQRIRPTKGMSRDEQLKGYEKTSTYGTASGTLQSDKLNATNLYDRGGLQVTAVKGSSQRSRPSSATSGMSATGKRSRPSSAKSNASMRSNASVRSNFSVRSNISIRSGMRPGSATRVDSRPEWNDRFAYT